MENLKQTLQSLCDLQKYDIAISKLNEAITEAPAKILQAQQELESKKEQTQNAKQEYVNLNSQRKEKEAMLESREQSIKKHSAELNSIKSNEAYKALSMEIEKAKADKSVVEDEILELLMKIDSEAVVVKTAETELKNFEQTIKSKIAEIESNVQLAKSEIEKIEKQRQQHLNLIDPQVLAQYERIKSGNSVDPIAFVETNSCSACGLVLRPQVLIDVKKGSNLIFCDGCCRILVDKT
ncbi:MAG: C4-type zinc ribbon domain-containing protein [Elusimicrobiota bacterium]|jgi:predicted  nucleic acid-binding Zn-ribbon protein|nr:C4-type zinc ribbon domain-containing protein [Elusimicrobiota bacterium]